MWVFENSDIVVNRLLDVEPTARVRATAKFAGFVAKAASSHPCHLHFPSTTKIKAVAGDVFVLHLPDHWWITFRVLPDCTAIDGVVRFLGVGQMAALEGN